MTIQFLVTSVTRGGVVRANVVPQSGIDKNALKESGMPGFGSLEFVAHDQKALEEEGWKAGKKFSVTIDEFDEDEPVSKPVSGQ